ncbi:MAG: hypothetical protein AB1716_05405 [Planctomycetota bacterium]
MSVGESLARRVFFPLHERLRGRRTLGEMRALVELAAQPAKHVERVCDARLRALLTFAAARLPFYERRFADAGVNPQATDPDAELARLPVLTKHVVRASAAEMTWPEVPGGLQPTVSGGTSGDTLHFHVDRVRQAQSMGARLFMQQLFGVRPGDRRMWLWGSPIELKPSRLRRVRDRLINELVLDAFDLAAARADAYLHRIAAYRPRLLIGYTSAVTLLAERALRTRDPRAFASLRAVVMTGDEVLPEQRAAVRAAFGCPAVSEYGSREVGLIAHDCPHGRMHVLTPHVRVEITREERRLPAGQCGRITCTNLNSRAQPLIRYDLGDVGVLNPAGCDCGLPFPVLEITGGRLTGFVVLPSGELRHGHLVAYLARAEPAVVEFKVYQRSLDALDVQIVANDQYTPAVLERIRRSFRTHFGAAVRVNCTRVDHIPPDPSGKRRHFVSQIAPQYERGLAAAFEQQTR